MPDNITYPPETVCLDISSAMDNRGAIKIFAKIKSKVSMVFI
jgi:hypothetical protein